MIGRAPESALCTFFDLDSCCTHECSSTHFLSAPGKVKAREFHQRRVQKRGVEHRAGRRLKGSIPTMNGKGVVSRRGEEKMGNSSDSCLRVSMYSYVVVHDT